MKIKKIVLSLLLICILGVLVYFIKNVNFEKREDNRINIVSSNFASYDFLRAIIGENENINLIFLLGPGKDPHSYDPTPADLMKIQNSSLFVYVGGQMEEWSNKVLDSMEINNIEIMCISDYVDTIEEKEIDGAEQNNDEEEIEGSFNEHIWTSPENAIKMVKALEKTMEKIDEPNSQKYRANAENYISKIKDVDEKIQNIVDNKKRSRLVFADKMPMQYFIDYYNLQVTAAFEGCSTDTEPSAKTIAYLENKIKEEKIPVVLYIELNTGKVAKIIADETKIETAQIQTLHNISLDDYNNGETWVSLMTRNLSVLEKALQ